MMMSQQLHHLRSALTRARIKAHDRMFELACRILLPISTMCKVCNILRGMMLGACLGAALTAVVFLTAGGRS
jgi:hypothetical protein